MDRLTERTGEGIAIPRMELRHNGYQRCMNLLAQYEEIGLTPEQLLQVDEMYADRCREIAGLERKIGIVEGKGIWRD